LRSGLCLASPFRSKAAILPPTRLYNRAQLDINLADDTKQADAMTNLFTMFWNDSNVKGITVWGYIVAATWMSNTGLMKSDGTMRPAMTWLMDFLGR
jgi:endo-1,4-beta-xylanase